MIGRMDRRSEGRRVDLKDMTDHRKDGRVMGRIVRLDRQIGGHKNDREDGQTT